MDNMMTAIREIVEQYPDVKLVFPVHPNPTVRKVVGKCLLGSEQVFLIEPLDYVEFANLLSRCYMVLTDSGGIQEEAPHLGKPVVVLRRETERPEAVEAGTVAMAGVDPKNIKEIMTMLLQDNYLHKKMSERVSPYGDGHASERILNILLSNKDSLREFDKS